MMAGTIAVITAVLVVNVNTEPEWVWRVLPTANNEGKEEFVECRTCKKAYDTDVLVKLTDNR